ncbi:hypothetical protein KOW79_005935 [Hemibagrus wyckioides]|uniref:Uncharacterized protein n=1 Tax=Hemibagrus wyckioides TaxID=337641 RepID=A0A9D3NYM5_9TELE|nr:hypothetical protein KOW79_005935 [Hemibagrus wyckioides]
MLGGKATQTAAGPQRIFLRASAFESAKQMCHEINQDPGLLGIVAPGFSTLALTETTSLVEHQSRCDDLRQVAGVIR